MHNPQTFLPKDDQRLPDTYNVKIFFHGEKEPLELELAHHVFVDKVFSNVVRDGIVVGSKELVAHSCPIFDYTTSEDEFGFIPYSAIKRLHFDKSYTRIIELRKEMLKKKSEQKKENQNEKSV